MPYSICNSTTGMLLTWTCLFREASDLSSNNAPRESLATSITSKRRAIISMGGLMYALQYYYYLKIWLSSLCKVRRKERRCWRWSLENSVTTPINMPLGFPVASQRWCQNTCICQPNWVSNEQRETRNFSHRDMSSCSPRTERSTSRDWPARIGRHAKLLRMKRRHACRQTTVSSCLSVSLSLSSRPCKFPKVFKCSSVHSTEFQWFELLNFVRAVIGVAACNSYLYVGLWIVFANYQWSIRKMSSTKKGAIRTPKSMWTVKGVGFLWKPRLEVLCFIVQEILRSS